MKINKSCVTPLLLKTNTIRGGVPQVKYRQFLTFISGGGKLEL